LSVRAESGVPCTSAGMLTPLRPRRVCSKKKVRGRTGQPLWLLLKSQLREVTYQSSRTGRRVGGVSCSMPPVPPVGDPVGFRGPASVGALQGASRWGTVPEVPRRRCLWRVESGFPAANSVDNIRLHGALLRHRIAGAGFCWVVDSAKGPVHRPRQ
jgi:hypothetical protein